MSAQLPPFFRRIFAPGFTRCVVVVFEVRDVFSVLPSSTQYSTFDEHLFSSDSWTEVIGAGFGGAGGAVEGCALGGGAAVAGAGEVCGGAGFGGAASVAVVVAGAAEGGGVPGEAGAAAGGVGGVGDAGAVGGAAVQAGRRRSVARQVEEVGKRISRG